MTTCRTKDAHEAADILGVKYQTLLGLIKTKRLFAVWIGNRYLIPDAAIAEFLGETVPAPRSAS